MIKIISLLFIIQTLCTAQTADSLFVGYPFPVDTIEINGNDITEEDIILRELSFEAGDSVSSNDLNYNRERIFSLGIFNRVDMYPDIRNNRNIIKIEVEESWYLYPVPFIELKDRNWQKLSYGFDLFIKNFRGRNETMRLRSAFGYDPSFYLSYTVPSLTRDGDYYLFSEFNYRDVKNKSKYALSLANEDFEQNFITANVGVGRRFGIFHRFSISGGYSYIKSPFYFPGISVSSGRIDRYPHLGFNYIYDTRDLIQFPNNGIYFNSALTIKGMGIQNINYQIFNLDFREYRKLFGELSGKWRLAGRFGLGGEIPTHDYSYIGFGEKVRGFYNTEIEGHHSYMFSAEIYYPFFKDVTVSLDFLPLLPDELLHYRTALYLQFFTDTGATQFRKEKIGYKDFISGYGTGLTLLILPYNILRVEFAVNENGLTEWILDLGISF